MRTSGTGCRRGGSNWYAYVGNDPINFIDPLGLEITRIEGGGSLVEPLTEYGSPTWSGDLHSTQRSLGSRSERILATLNPTIQADARAVVNTARNEGIDAYITHGLRTFEEQNQLYAKGRDEEGNITDKDAVVTNARGGQSYHNYGVAFDVAILDSDNGSFIWDYEDPQWERIGEIGRENNFEWGGDWDNPYDPPHFQRTNGMRTSQFLAQKKEDEGGCND